MDELIKYYLHNVKLKMSGIPSVETHNYHFYIVRVQRKSHKIISLQIR